MPSLQSQSYVFDARPHYPLLVSTKRYWIPGFGSTDDDAVTLILAHATSFHKELWEPFLEELYAQAAASSATGSPLVKIRDAWAIDCPNHGESAMLNEETLLFGYTPICKSYAGLAGVLLKSAESCTGESYSLVGGIRTSNSSHLKRFWKRHRHRLQISQPRRGGSFYGDGGYVSP